MSEGLSTFSFVLNYIVIIWSVWGTMSHSCLCFQKFSLWHCAFSVKICWMTLTFYVPAIKDWMSCSSLASCPFYYISFSLCFCLYQVFSLDLWIPRPPPPWPAGVGAGVVAGASWPSTWRPWALGKGILCPHPPCSLLHSSLWVSPLPSQTLMCPWLTVHDSEFLLDHHKTILTLALSVSILPMHKGCFAVKEVSTFTSPQLSKWYVTLPILFQPSAQWNIRLNWEEGSS